jgi:hypothetical protein
MQNRRRILFPILTSAMISLMTKASAADQIDGFTKLPSGNTLQMRFTSGGCFHFYILDLTFTSSPRPAATVFDIVLEPAETGKGTGLREAGREKRGKLSLSKNDLAGLDNLLAFYRTNTAAGCTTHNGIEISQVRDGKIVASEKFQDNSCGARRINGVLTIGALEQRLPNKLMSPKNSATGP